MEPDRDLLLDLERLRLSWDFASKEVELHKQRQLQVFAAFVTLALTAVGSVALDRVPAAPGLGFASLMVVGAAYAHLRMVRLNRFLAEAYARTAVAIERLKLEGGP